MSLSLASDAELMRRVQAGEAEAFGALYDRYSGAVYGLAHRIVGERAGAEDVVQESFLALWRSRAAYADDRGTPTAWLLTITRHRAIDAIRRQKPGWQQPLEPADEPEAPERTDDEVVQRLDAATIGEALGALPEAQRRVLELAYFGGLSQTEIADREQIPLGTVKSRLRLALRRLAAADLGYQSV